MEHDWVVMLVASMDNEKVELLGFDLVE